MNPAIVVLLTAAAFLIARWFTRRFCDPDSFVYTLDYPNVRSLHDRPVPRGGGLAILLAIMVCGAIAMGLYPAEGMGWAALAILMVAGISFVDDRCSVSPVYRLMAHFLAAGVALYGGFVIQTLEMPHLVWSGPYVAGAMFSTLYMVWMINLYNFMDGMDGFSGGMAVAGFGVFAVMGWLAGNDSFLIFSLIIVAASTGFLIFNFPPARIFMGDVGSSVLGLLAAMFCLWGARDGIFPFWIGVLVFSPFIVDATVTLLRRLGRQEKVWQAHKSHFYQQLVQAGWGHRRTVLIEYAIMLACGGTAVLALRTTADMQSVLFAAWVIFYFAFFSWISWVAARRNRGST